MKKAALLLAVLLLCSALLLPVSAATPKSAYVQAAVGAVGASLGKDTPGAAVILFENGVCSMREAYGYADIQGRTLTTALTSFELGELSSLFVALAAHTLADRGLLELDRDIAHYLPAGFVKKLDLQHAVTTNDLLWGRAGFASRTFDLHYDNERYCFATLDEALLADVPEQIAAPGTYFGVDAFSIGLAAYVVECVSGVRYAEYAGRAVLEPLGMKNTLLDPRAESEINAPALGHISVGDGSFSLAADNGRSYGAIWPYDGAISTPADMERLLSFLCGNGVEKVFSAAYRESAQAITQKNGVFDVAPLGLSVSASAEGTVFSKSAQTSYFGASLAFSGDAKSAALVMTNTANSALLTLPEAIFGVLTGVAVAPGYLPDPAGFVGFYGNALADRDSFVGRISLKNSAVEAYVNADGALCFGDMVLRQLAPGVFADAASGSDNAVLQFVTDAEGNVTAVLCADGKTLVPLSNDQHGVLATALLVVLLCVAFYFLLGGILGPVSNFFNERPHAFRFVLPWIFLGLLGLLVLSQIAVAYGLGSAAFASFFTAFSVLSLLAAIGAVLSLLWAFFTAFTERGRTSRVVRTSVLYLVFLILCSYWQLIII